MIPDLLDQSHPQFIVVWRVTEACSLGCHFCGYSRDVSGIRRTIDLHQAAAFADALSDFQQKYAIPVLVSLLGGEPLAWSALPGLARHLRDACRLQLGVTTNGLPLSSATVRQDLLSHYRQLTVSIDGDAGFHDWVRGMPGLYATVQAAVAHLRTEDRTRKLLLRVNTVLMRDNIERFPQFALEMARWGFDELTFNQLGGNERPAFHADHHLLPYQVERFCAELPEVRRRAAELGLCLRGTDRYLHRLLCSSHARRIAVEDCGPGTSILFVSERGRVSPCSFTCEGYGIPLAEIRSAAAIHNLSARWSRARQQNRLAACLDCHATHVFDKFGCSLGGREASDAELRPAQNDLPSSCSTAARIESGIGTGRSRA